MAQNDRMQGLMQDLAAGFGLLTRLPVPVAASSANMAWCWPVVGLVVALLSGGAGLVLIGLGLPLPLAAGVALLVQVMITGALHEDGLADSADGLWGGHTRQRRLEIMKDSRIGTYGVLALLLVVGLRWQALALCLATGILPLIAAAMLSRAAMAGVMALLPHARDDGLARSVGQPEPFFAAAAAGLALVLGGMAVGWAVLPAAVAAVLAAAAAAWVAQQRIGGQTGDILGAVQQISELAVLLTLVALA